MAPCITAAHYVILTSFEHLLTAHSAHRSHHNTPLHHHLILILLLLHDDDDVDTLMSRPSRSLISLGPAGEAYSAPPLLAGIFRGRKKRKGRGEEEGQGNGRKREKQGEGGWDVRGRRRNRESGKEKYASTYG